LPEAKEEAKFKRCRFARLVFGNPNAQIGWVRPLLAKGQCGKFAPEVACFFAIFRDFDFAK
jgi:hypothetical protein